MSGSDLLQNIHSSWSVEKSEELYKKTFMYLRLDFILWVSIKHQISVWDLISAPLFFSQMRTVMFWRKLQVLWLKEGSLSQRWRPESVPLHFRRPFQTRSYLRNCNGNFVCRSNAWMTARHTFKSQDYNCTKSDLVTFPEHTDTAGLWMPSH